MLAAIIAIIAVIADQVTKHIVNVNLPNEGDSVPFIPGFMSFTRYHNTGAAWSVMDGGGWERVILLTVSFISMGLILFLLIKYYNRHKLFTVSLAMVLGGAVGNMIDRIRLEYVIDFLHTEFIDFPTFNVADSFITVGAVLLAVYVIFFESKVEKRLQAQQEAENSGRETEPVAEQAEVKENSENE